MKLLFAAAALGTALGYAAFGDDPQQAPQAAPAPPESAKPSDPPARPSPSETTHPAGESAVAEQVPPGTAAVQDPPSTPAEPPRVAPVPVIAPIAIPLDPKDAEADRRVTAAAEGAERAPIDAETMRVLLEETLGKESPQLAAIDVLDQDVDRLRKTLGSIVGQGVDTKSALESVPGFERELEAMGIAPEIAAEIRALYPEVQQLRGELMLLDLRTQKSEADFSPVPAPEDLAAEDDAEPDDEPPPASRPRSPFPDKEAIVCFRKGDAAATIEILLKQPEAELDESLRFALGSVLVAKRRFEEARRILKPLTEDVEHPLLAAAAERQIARMHMIETGVVSLAPLIKEMEMRASVSDRGERRPAAGGQK